MESLAYDLPEFLWKISDWFEKKQVLAHSSAGTPYLRNVSFGMPTIPPPLLDCVVYLYRNKQLAENNGIPGGTGFLVGMPLPGLSNIWDIYAVTNHHVAVGKGHSCIRVNKRLGGSDVFPFSSDQWEHIPGLDLAAIPMPYDPQKYKIEFIPESFFMKPPLVLGVNLAVGEDVFMIGAFVDNHGKEFNTPAGRFGNISLMPSYMEIDAPLGGKYRGEYYCLDMRSRGGFSGSPVFYYRTIGGDLSQAGSTNMRIEPPAVGFIGAHAGQYPESLELKDGAGKETTLTGPSGMTMVIPAQKISDLLNLPKFVAQRKLNATVIKAKIEQQGAQPILESSDAANDLATETLRVMLNTPPTPHKDVG